MPFAYYLTDKNHSPLNPTDATQVDSFDAWDEELGIAISTRKNVIEVNTLPPHQREDQAGGGRLVNLEAKELDDEAIEEIIFLTHLKLQETPGKLPDGSNDDEKTGSTLRLAILRSGVCFDSCLGDSQLFSVDRNGKTAQVKGHNENMHHPKLPAEQERLIKAGFKTKETMNESIGGVTLSGSIGDNDSVSAGLTQLPHITKRILPKNCSEVIITSDGCTEKPKIYDAIIGKSTLLQEKDKLSAIIADKALITYKFPNGTYIDDHSVVMMSVDKNSSRVKIGFVNDGHRGREVSIRIHHNLINYMEEIAQLYLDILRANIPDLVKQYIRKIIQDSRETIVKLNCKENYTRIPNMRRELLTFVSKVAELVKNKELAGDQLISQIDIIKRMIAESQRLSSMRDIGNIGRNLNNLQSALVTEMKDASLLLRMIEFTSTHISITGFIEDKEKFSQDAFAEINKIYLAMENYSLDKAQQKKILNDLLILLRNIENITGKRCTLDCKEEMKLTVLLGEIPKYRPLFSWLEQFIKKLPETKRTLIKKQFINLCYEHQQNKIDNTKFQEECLKLIFTENTKESTPVAREFVIKLQQFTQLPFSFSCYPLFEDPLITPSHEIWIAAELQRLCHHPLPKIKMLGEAIADFEQELNRLPKQETDKLKAGRHIIHQLFCKLYFIVDEKNMTPNSQIAKEIMTILNHDGDILKTKKGLQNFLFFSKSEIVTKYEVIHSLLSDIFGIKPQRDRCCGVN